MTTPIATSAPLLDSIHSGEIFNAVSHVGMTTDSIEKSIVLVVDDQPEDITILIASLQACGVTILVARQGQQAIDLAEQFTPDVILLNVLIPGVDGFEVCRQLKARSATQDIPVIFMTSSLEMVAKLKRLEIEGIDYFTKPLQPQEIIARMTAYLTIRKLQKQLQEHHPLWEERLALADHAQHPQIGNQDELGFREAIKAYEKRLIANALAQNVDNMTKTAASLGMPLRTLYRKIKAYRLV